MRTGVDSPAVGFMNGLTMVLQIVLIVLSVLIVVAVFMTKSKKHAMDHHIRRRGDRESDDSTS